MGVVARISQAGEETHTHTRTHTHTHTDLHPVSCSGCNPLCAPLRSLCPTIPHTCRCMHVLMCCAVPVCVCSERLSQRLSYPVTSPSQRSPSTGPEPLLRPSLSSPTQHAPRLSLSRTAPSPSYTTSNTQQPPQQTQIYSNPLAFAPPDSARSPRQSQQASPRRGSQGSGGGGVPVRVSRQGSPSYMSPMVGRPSAVDLVVNGGQQRASSLGYGSPGM